MKRLTLLALLIPLSLPVAAMAQSDRTPGAAARQAPSPRLAKPKPAMRTCPEFGAGFVRLEGSDTCVRIGGYLDVGTGIRHGRR